MVKRRDIVSLLCMIAFSVPLIIYLFGGGLIVHAEGNVVPIPSGYSSLGDIIPYETFKDNIYTLQNCNPNDDDLSGYITDVLDESNILFSEDMFDGDLSNGEYIIDDNTFYTSMSGYVPIFNDSGNITGWTQEVTPVNFDNYYLGYNMTNNSFNLCFTDGIIEFDTTKASNGATSFIGFAEPVLEGTQRGNKIAFYNGTLLRGYNNVYVFGSTYQSFVYPSTFKLGDYPGSIMCQYTGNQYFIGSSYRCHYLNKLSERDSNNNGYLEVQVPSGNGSQGTTFTSEIYGEPHLSFNPSNIDEDNSYPDGSGGDITNNMYLETADWKFNIPKYWGNVTSTLVQPKYTANWGSGTVSFYGLCNDFIQDNADDYKLVFNFYVKCNGHRFSDTHSEIDENFAKSFAWRSVEYDLADYLNNKSINVDFSVSDIFSNSWDQGMSTNVTNYLETIKTYNSIDNWDWSLSCDAQIVSGSYTSGSIQENYNFISQVSKEVSNTITQNNNPYYPEDENGKPIIPDSDGTTSITDKNGNITLTNYDNDNNNQSVVINGNDKSVIDGLIDKLVPNAQGNGGLTERFVNLTNANGWFAVMSSALPLMGSDFWSTLQLMFVTSLGILGCAFVIWIIVHII